MMTDAKRTPCDTRRLQPGHPPATTPLSKMKDALAAAATSQLSLSHMWLVDVKLGGTEKGLFHQPRSSCWMAQSGQ